MTEDRRARERDKAIEMAVHQIEKQFGKGAIMRLGQSAIAAIPRISTGSISIDHALGIGGVPRGRVVEIFGPEASGKTTLALQVIAQAQQRGGTAAFVDAGACARPYLCEQARDRSRQPPGLATGQRRTSARDRGGAGAIWRRRRCGRRFGRGARTARRDRRRDGRRAGGPAGAADVASAPEAHRGGLEVEHLSHLHQPAACEDRRHVRQSGDHDRRPGVEVLLVGPNRHPSDWRHQGRRRDRRQPDPSQDRQEQGGPTVPNGRVRSDLWRRGLPRG